MRTRLPIPATWQDFEALCHQLWKQVWSDPNAQPNGRSGQVQAGVDVWGRPIYTAHLAGVQCKDKNGNLGSKLTKAELLRECGKAKSFSPRLDVFTMATTAPRDAPIQTIARELNDKSAYPFQVHVWSWDDIEAEVASRPALIEEFYPRAPNQTIESAVRIAASAPRDQFWAFFSRPSIAQALGDLVRDSLIQVAYELCDNAFLHGKAKQVRLEFDGAKLAISDDGVAFDATSSLDAGKASAAGHLGSLVFRSFVDRYAGRIGVGYERVQVNDGIAHNVLTFNIGDEAREESVPEVMDISVDLSAIFSRRSAEGLALSLAIPTGIKELVITVGNTQIISGSSEFIRHMRQRLPDSVELTVSYPRGHFLGEIATYFAKQRINFRPR